MALPIAVASGFVLALLVPLVRRLLGPWAYLVFAALPAALASPPAPDVDPCLGCPAPCASACPVDAFRTGAYDVPACIRHLKSPEGGACTRGCLVRRSCPAGANLDLPAEQLAFHMSAFLTANG